MIPSHPRHPFFPLNLLAISSFSRPCFESHARDAPLDRTRRTRIGVPSWLKRRKKEEKEKEKEKEERGTSPVRTFEDERGRTTGRKKGKKKKGRSSRKGVKERRGNVVRTGREGEGKGYYTVKERRSEGRERKRRRGGTQRCAGRVAEEGWKREWMIRWEGRRG